jgi:hypothetical protein
MGLLRLGSELRANVTQEFSKPLFISLLPNCSLVPHHNSTKRELLDSYIYQTLPQNHQGLTMDTAFEELRLLVQEKASLQQEEATDLVKQALKDVFEDGTGDSLGIVNTVICSTAIIDRS